MVARPLRACSLRSLACGTKEVLQKASPKERLEGLTADDLLGVLPPEVRAALARRLKEKASAPLE